jgi:hypothetical protein
VSLPDVVNGGEEFQAVAEEGHLLVLFFGYTSCPDVCPTTMSDLRLAVEGLGGDANRIDIAFVTVDPQPGAADFLYPDLFRRGPCVAHRGLGSSRGCGADLRSLVRGEAESGRSHRSCTHELSLRNRFDGEHPGSVALWLHI